MKKIIRYIVNTILGLTILVIVSFAVFVPTLLIYIKIDKYGLWSVLYSAGSYALTIIIALVVVGLFCWLVAWANDENE